MPSDSEDELHPLCPARRRGASRPARHDGPRVLYFSCAAGGWAGGVAPGGAGGGVDPDARALWAMPVALMTSELGSAAVAAATCTGSAPSAAARRRQRVVQRSALLGSSSYPAMFCGYVTFALNAVDVAAAAERAAALGGERSARRAVCALSLRGISRRARVVALAYVWWARSSSCSGSLRRPSHPPWRAAQQVRALAAAGCRRHHRAAAPGAAATAAAAAAGGRPTGCCCSPRRCGRRGPRLGLAPRR